MRLLKKKKNAMEEERAIVEKWNAVKGLCKHESELEDFSRRFAVDWRVSDGVLRVLAERHGFPGRVLAERMEGRLREGNGGEMCTECERWGLEGKMYRMTSWGEKEARFICRECIDEAKQRVVRGEGRAIKVRRWRRIMRVLIIVALVLLVIFIANAYFEWWIWG